MLRSQRTLRAWQGPQAFPARLRITTTHKHRISRYDSSYLRVAQYRGGAGKVGRCTRPARMMVNLDSHEYDTGGVCNHALTRLYLTSAEEVALHQGKVNGRFSEAPTMPSRLPLPLSIRNPLTISPKPQE